MAKRSRRGLVALGLAMALGGIAGCSRPAAPSVASPLPVPTVARQAAIGDVNVALPGGKRATLHDATSCQSLSGAFLTTWCQTLEGAAPQTLDASKVDSSALPAIYGTVAASLVRGDDAACSDKAVVRWLEMSLGGSGDTTCLASLKTYRAQGWFAVSDPATGATVVVSLGKWPAPVE